MEIVRTKARLSSEITVDQDLNMGAYDIVLGARSIETTDLRFKQKDSDGLIIRNLADDADKALSLGSLLPSSFIEWRSTAKGLDSINADGGYIILRARDTGVGKVEVAQLVGAADPYFQASLPMVLKPSSMPGTPVEGMLHYDATLDKIQYRDASATRLISYSSPDLTTLIAYHTDGVSIGATTTVECVNVTGQGGVIISMLGVQSADVDLKITVDGTLIKTATCDTAFEMSVTFFHSLLVQIVNPEAGANNCAETDVHGNYGT